MSDGGPSVTGQVSFDRAVTARVDPCPHGDGVLFDLPPVIADAAASGPVAVDPVVLAAQIRLFRSAVLAGASQTAPHSGALMKKHHALARRLRDRQDDYLWFTQDFRAPPDNDLASH